MGKSLNPLKTEVHHRNADIVKSNAAEATAVTDIIILFYLSLPYICNLPLKGNKDSRL